MLAGVPLLDMHHHFMPADVLADLQKEAGGAPRLVNDRLSVTLDPQLADVDGHLEVMRAAGLDAALLTYSALSILGQDVCRALNDGAAELQGAHGGVLYGAAHVDLQDARGAVAELRRATADLQLRALALPTSAREVQLDDVALRPLWALTEELGLPVVLHPASLPAGASRDHGLERSCARPFDTTAAVVRILHGVLPHFPTLRFVAPHCGGTAPYLKGRIQMFFTPPGATPRSLPRTQNELRADGYDEVFEQLWSQIYVDTAGNGGWTPVTKSALEILGPDRVCFGSDFPLESHSAATMTELVEALDSLGLGAEALGAVASGNAGNLLGLDGPEGVGDPPTAPASRPDSAGQGMS